ncbi:hypothetical protein R5R35_006773 [Gryllus longicercus]|uniref:C2H2-type domain-containing protein n=1 Tax=Gryllus longicercus TaxID=2509291 RepID=A0AAN9VBN9_9ORTH
MAELVGTECVSSAVIINSWQSNEDPSVSPEEVICGVANDCIIFPEPRNVTTIDSSINLSSNDTVTPDTIQVKLDPGTIEVVHYEFPEQDLFNIQVAEEEVICETWDNAEVAHEEVVQMDGEEQGGYNASEDPDDVEIPLPLDQDAYTTMRPYPCDFCSRRFRKKANLMNHMVAHQTDRPHGCNLCGARYRRKCDLINHMKIHAYKPARDVTDDDEEEEEPVVNSVPNNTGARGRRKKVFPQKKRKTFPTTSTYLNKPSDSVPFTKGGRKKNITNLSRKKHIDNSVTPSVSTAHSYIEEDVRLLKESTSHFPDSEDNSEDQKYDTPAAEEKPPRWPVVDESRPYVCQHCGVGFAREKALGSHSRVHAGDSPFECNTCGEMFWDIGILREHKKAKHGNRLEYETLDTGDDRFGDFHCETCGLAFHRQDLLKRHRRLHVKTESGTEDNGDYSCQVCGGSFTTEPDLLAHMETHARYQPHRCMLCGECFLDSMSVAAHVRKRHAKNIPPNACTLCGKTCRDRRSLQKHSWVHSAERSFPCHKCGKRFHSRARLKRHMVSHRDKAVTCEECNEEFPDGRALINHRHSHNKDQPGRQFSCHECGKTFGSRSSQQIHARIHTGERPYGCRFCWKAFADGGTLRKHERIHTGEKPYACPVCPRAFNQRVVLREHIRSHHSGPEVRAGGGYPATYLCKVCSCTFTTSEDLCAHLIKHSDENTAKQRTPKIGPRKYKRRRKLTQHELDLLLTDPVDSGNRSDEDTDDFDDVKHKISKKKYKTKGRSNTTENLESVAKSFDSVLENFNSLTGNSKTDAAKKKHKVKGRYSPEKRTGNSAVNNSICMDQSKPSVSRSLSGGFLKSTRPAGQGRVRPRTKNVTLSALAALKAVSSKPNSAPDPSNNSELNRARPRTKNVNYHNVKMAKLQTARFPNSPKASGGKAKPKAALKQRQSPNIKGSPKAAENVVNDSVPEAAPPQPSAVSSATEQAGGHEVKVEFTCEMCSETFTKRSELLVHVPIHI